MLRINLTLAALIAVAPSLVAGQTFTFTSQERSVFARVSTFTSQKSATDFGTFDENVGVTFGNAGAGSGQRSVLGTSSISLFGDLGAINSPTLSTQARGVFDVSFTLTQATDLRFFYVVNSAWNFTIWTPSGSQVIATSADLGGIYDDRVSHFAAGTYRLRADADVTEGKSGNITVEMTIVPAPSGVALAACAGLAACRRRRR